jgi:hypothetical protein
MAMAQVYVGSTQVITSPTGTENKEVGPKAGFYNILLARTSTECPHSEGTILKNPY